MKSNVLILFLLAAAAALPGAGCSPRPASETPAEIKPPPPAEAPGTAPVVVLETTQGDIEIRLMPETAPKAVENFKGLVSKGYYDGVIFHRVIKGFMIQGGDPEGTGRGGDSLWSGPFRDEVEPGVSFDRPGLAAMANAGPDTNRSQFFITTDETPWLNMRHTIFGEVASGMETVRKIEETPTGPGDRPVEEQAIIRAYLK